MLDDDDTDAGHAFTTSHAMALWQQHWPDDRLVSIPELGPISALAIRGWWGKATQFPSTKARGGQYRVEPVDLVRKTHRSPITVDP